MIQSPCSKFDSPFWAMVWCEMIAAVEHVQLYTMWKEKLAWDMVWFIYDLSGLYPGLTLEISGSKIRYDAIFRPSPGFPLRLFSAASGKKDWWNQESGQGRKFEILSRKLKGVYAAHSAGLRAQKRGGEWKREWKIHQSEMRYFFSGLYSSFAFPARNCVMANRIFCALLSLT